MSIGGGKPFTKLIKPSPKTMSEDKDENEVTLFGVDYDGAISAGQDAWQCEECAYWNNSQRNYCVKCEYEEDE